MAMFFGIDDLEWLLTNQVDDFFAMLIMIIFQFPLFSKVNTEKKPSAQRGSMCGRCWTDLEAHLSLTIGENTAQSPCFSES